MIVAQILSKWSWVIVAHEKYELSYLCILHMYIYVANSTVYEKMKKGLTYHKLLCSTSNFQIGKAEKKSKVLQ